jgi:hypothetical protein
MGPQQISGALANTVKNVRIPALSYGQNYSLLPDLAGPCDVNDGTLIFSTRSIDCYWANVRRKSKFYYREG